MAVCNKRALFEIERPATRVHPRLAPAVLAPLTDPAEGESADNETLYVLENQQPRPATPTEVFIYATRFLGESPFPHVNALKTRGDIQTFARRAAAPLPANELLVAVLDARNVVLRYFRMPPIPADKLLTLMAGLVRLYQHGNSLVVVNFHPQGVVDPLDKEFPAAAAQAGLRNVRYERVDATGSILPRCNLGKQTTELWIGSPYDRRPAWTAEILALARAWDVQRLLRGQSLRTSAEGTASIQLELAPIREPTLSLLLLTPSRHLLDYKQLGRGRFVGMERHTDVIVHHVRSLRAAPPILICARNIPKAAFSESDFLPCLPLLQRLRPLQIAPQAVAMVGTDGIRYAIHSLHPDVLANPLLFWEPDGVPM